MADDEFGENPFVGMYLAPKETFVTSSEITEFTEIYGIAENNFNEQKPEPLLSDELENSKPMLFDEDPMLSSANFSLDDDAMFDQSQMKTEIFSSAENDDKKKRGRPPKDGSIINNNNNNNNKEKKPRKHKKIVDGSTPATPQDKLPRMKANVHNIRMTDEEVVEHKKNQDVFAQPGCCYVIAPHLDSCVECQRQKKRGRKPRPEVDCRFYQFRKLKYEGDKLVVAGFPDPFIDPKEVDIAIWMPQQDKPKFRGLSVPHARLIVAHVGDEFCRLIEKERIYFNKYKTIERPMIWKRPIDRVLEICDLCSTTLFNYHFICTKCGLSLCVDCEDERNPNLEETNCTVKDNNKHSFDEFHLTQIIPSDCMNKLQRMLHDIVDAWEIEHSCTLNTEPIIEMDRAMRAVIYNILNDGEVGKCFMNREIQLPFQQIEMNLSGVNFDEFPQVHNEPVKLPKPQKPIPKHIRTIRYHTESGRENIVSISRSMSQDTSELFYNVPHKWLCENKLLRLLDPLHPGNEEFFSDQWQRGHPVLISKVLDLFKKDHWLPQSFSNEFGSNIADFINCMNGNLVRNKEIALFWDGFEIVEKRLRDNEGTPMLLKLKDWPPDSDFKILMPSRFEDVMKNLPVNAYTNRTGDLNIVKYLPNCFIHPDLGPKGYFAYGCPFYLKEGTTNLHLDIADACNVMCYIGFPRDKDITMEEYIEQGFKAILESDADVSNIDRVIRDGEIPGAIWHIFEATDADRIRDFLLKIAIERGFKVAQDHDVIHDQNWYLDGELRKRLHAEYGVKGYAIVQCLGDCIILPAGTPHQVRNIYSCIKIAEDFVSPQQMAHCLHLSDEFRKLTKTHTNNEEKLNIKNIAYHSIKEAITMLIHIANKIATVAKETKLKGQE